jgi:hypothetical protein
MPETTSTNGSPTAVLVQGAFADSSRWNGVIDGGCALLTVGGLI